MSRTSLPQASVAILRRYALEPKRCKRWNILKKLGLAYE
jgi:hypothetical protein